ncbi:hypothetical protein Golomagni_05211 [Golovinomyces magnicellulatus]|nr:hypothetical protein Golomagni_05211 [Golovinomyces magnicellulatus]
MKFLSLIIVLALVMLVVSSPLPKSANSDDSKDLKTESNDDSKNSKDDSKNAKAESNDDSKKSKDDSKNAKAESNDDSKKSKDDSKNAKAESNDDSKKSKDDSKTASAAAAGSVAESLRGKKYNDIQISGGVAGNAKEEAEAIFKGIDRNNLAALSKEDLKAIQSVHDVAEQAEKDAFNPAIENATAEEKDALKIGKTKNKVFKITATILRLEGEKAQGKDVSAEIAKEKAKLDKNVAADVAAKGDTSKNVSFDGTT